MSLDVEVPKGAKLEEFIAKIEVSDNALVSSRVMAFLHLLLKPAEETVKATGKAAKEAFRGEM